VSTQLIERPEVVEQQATTGEPGKHTHIILEGFKTPDDEYHKVSPSVIEGMVEGTPVKTLCGEQFVPQNNPAKYSVCPRCIDICKELGWSVPTS
jgi:hypothetical protein